MHTRKGREITSLRLVPRLLSSFSNLQQSSHADAYPLQTVTELPNFIQACSILNQRVPRFLEALVNGTVNGTLDYKGYVHAGQRLLVQLFRTLLGV
jgi:hypothetical protein